jgi:hypothetical protein
MTKAKLILLALVISAKCFAQTTVTRTVQANLDTLVTTTAVSSVTLKYKPPVTPPNNGGMVTIGKVASGPVTIKSNTTYKDLIFDGKNASVLLANGNGASNVTFKRCKFINTTYFAMLLNGCKNVTVDSCFFSNIGFGIYAQSGSAQIQVTNCQFLNVNGITGELKGHSIQFNNVNGAGNKINNNRIENIAGKALHPHDQISLYNCNGTQASVIEIYSNLIRGGQQYFWPGSTASSSGATAIGVGDTGGSWQVAKNNIIVNPGFIGIQNSAGSNNNIVVDSNEIFGDTSPIAGAGLVYQGGTKITYSNNKVNYVRPNGSRLDYNSNSKTGITLTNNTWAAKIDSSILPKQLITFQ